MKVLYVEDNPANVFLVKRVARMGNHEIVNYIDGDKAIEKFEEINPDLVLMDIQLAGNKSGLDVVKALRAKGIETPIIAVTAYAMVGDKERCIEAGCNDYLPKPLPIQRLVEIFKQHADAADKASTKVAPVKQDDTDKAQASTEVEATKDDTVAKTSEQAPIVASTTTAETTDKVKETSSATNAPEQVKSTIEDKLEKASEADSPAKVEATTKTEESPSSTDNTVAVSDEATSSETVVTGTVTTPAESVNNTKD